MAKSIQFAAFLLLATSAALCAQAVNRKMDRTPPYRPVLPKTGLPKGPTKGTPLSNPASPAARLYRATPEQRERALEKIPSRLQDRMRKELQRFDSAPKDQQEIMIRRAEALAALPSEKQTAFIQQMQAMNRLDPDRNRAVRQALMRLQRVPDDQRQTMLGSEEFRSRFSAEELQIITDLVAVMLPPQSK
jgi:hypothetical protein